MKVRKNIGAIEAPIIQIGDNAGVDGAVVLEEVKGKDFGYGYNAATDEYEDLLKAGVIDPALVAESGRGERPSGAAS